MRKRIPRLLRISRIIAWGMGHGAWETKTRGCEISMKKNCENPFNLWKSVDDSFSRSFAKNSHPIRITTPRNTPLPHHTPSPARSELYNTIRGASASLV